jgi:threonine dehydrogenase-like Zn-dependent dehydrogenase
MHSYRAAFLYGKEDIRIEDASISSPGAGEVLVHIRHCSLCPTDLKKYLDSDGKYSKVIDEKGPYILGHEASGRVAETGEGITEFQQGDMVVILPIIPCGVCEYCSRGEQDFCSRLVGIGGSAGFFGDCVDLYHNKGYGGCYGELLKLPASQIVKVPKELPLSTARLLEPVADVVYSIEKTGGGSSDPALIIGLGPMGLFHIPVLRAAGVKTIIGSDPRKDRRDVALKIGATAVIDPTKENVIEKTKEYSGGLGVQQGYVACGGSVQSGGVVDALFACRKGGVVNSFASLYNGKDPRIDINYLHYNHLSLVGTVGFQDRHVPKAFDVLLTYSEEFDLLLDPILPFSRFQKGLEAALSSNSLKVGIDFG